MNKLTKHCLMFIFTLLLWSPRSSDQLVNILLMNTNTLAKRLGLLKNSRSFNSSIFLTSFTIPFEREKMQGIFVHIFSKLLLFFRLKMFIRPIPYQEVTSGLNGSMTIRGMWLICPGLMKGRERDRDRVYYAIEHYKCSIVILHWF